MPRIPLTGAQRPSLKPETNMQNRNIIITAPDHARLNVILNFGNLYQRERGEMDALTQELECAEIVAPDAVPPEVITMNSRAELLDLDTGQRMAFTLVFPGEADPSAGKVSVLAPIGAGMLGYQVGDSFERRTPYGMRRLKIIDVLFQPEAALAAAA